MRRRRRRGRPLTSSSRPTRRSAPTPRSAREAVIGAGDDRRRRAPRSRRSALHPGLPGRRRRHGHAARSSPPASIVEDGAARPDGSVIGAGATITADAGLEPGARVQPEETVMSMSDLAERHRRASTRAISSTRRCRCPTTSATPSGASPRRSSSRSSRTGLLVCGMGGSAIGGDLAAAAHRHPPGQPLDVVRGYGVPSWTPPDRVDLLLQLLGQHRGDARPATTPPRPSARGGSSPRPAARSARPPAATGSP